MMNANTLKNKVLDFSLKHRLLPEDGVVLAAVSGGADSMCMLALLMDICRERALTLHCAHFNHMLRGEDSDSDARFVEDFCVSRGLPFTGGSGDVADYAEKNGLGIEEAARGLRYAFLERTAEETGAARIFTAHNMNDNAETMLLNLARGSGTRGLAGIPPMRGRIARPLLCVTRTEIEAYLAVNGITHVEDATNASDDYARNRIRRRVLPVLLETNPGFLDSALRASGLNREDDAYLYELAREFIEKHLTGGSALPVKALSELPRPVSGRVLRIMAGSACTQFAHRDIPHLAPSSRDHAYLSFDHVEALRELLASERPSYSLDLPGMKVSREYGLVRFGATEPRLIGEREVIPGQTIEILPGLTVKCAFLEQNDEEVNSSLNIFCFNYDKICGKISVRSRADGDNLKISGRDGTRSLKKLFSDAKIPKFRRGEIPVFSDEAGVIAVAGFGTAERCAATPGKPALTIKLEII